MSMGRDIKTGNVEAVEVGNQIPGQMSVQDLQTNSVGVVDGQAVDTETGEILGDAQQDGKVIDLRTKQAQEEYKMMEGLREALQFITDLKEDALEPKIVEITDKTYFYQSLGGYGKEYLAEAITACTLTSMVDYIKQKSDDMRESSI